MACTGVYGVSCRVALVDLSRQSVDIVEFPCVAYEYFPGGRGLGVALLSRLIDRDGYPMVFVAGALAGSGYPMANRLTMVFKSPLTGTVAWANTGGYVGPELKKAGLDAIAIVGRSREPVYLLASGGSVEILGATGLWGSGALETVSILQARHMGSKVLAIGPAGEGLARIANVINCEGRASGVRHGPGWVLGWKRVKAVVVSGGGSRLSVADKPGRMQALKAAQARISASPLINRDRGLLAVYGTPIAVEALGPAEALPHKNFRHTRVKGYERLGGKALSATVLESRLTCSYCPVACRRETGSSGRYKFRCEGPDYAQISSLGTNAGLMDLEAVSYLSYISYKVGVDPIEMGNLLAMLAEATEAGSLDPRSEGLEWGDANRMVEIIHEAGNGEGVGSLLAEGALEAAARLGYPELAMSVKGITIQNTDPRVEPAWGLVNAVESFGGAAHIWVYGDLVRSFRSIHVPQLVRNHRDPGEVARAVWHKQALVAVVDSLGVCAFSTYALTLDSYVQAIRAVNGLHYTQDALLDVGKRVLGLERVVNQRLGIDHRRADTLPSRFLEEPVPDGRNKGLVCELEPMLKEYYSLRGLEGGNVPSSERRELESLARESIPL